MISSLADRECDPRVRDRNVLRIRTMSTTAAAIALVVSACEVSSSSGLSGIARTPDNQGTVAGAADGATYDANPAKNVGGEPLFDNAEMLDPTPPTADKWPVGQVTYCILNGPTLLQGTDPWGVVREAFQEWDNALDPLQFSETQNLNQCDIRVKWAAGDHGDGCVASVFDGGGINTLAHAYRPHALPCSVPVAGNVHFDDAELWSTKEVVGAPAVDLKTVALHEIGHALGLHHSSVLSAVMYARYLGANRHLTTTDLGAVSSLYVTCLSCVDGNACTDDVCTGSNCDHIPTKTGAKCGDGACLNGTCLVAQPSVSVAPASVAPGDPVTITGIGFFPGGAVKLGITDNVQNLNHGPGQVVADPSGSFSEQFTGEEGRSYQLWARDETTNADTAAGFVYFRVVWENCKGFCGKKTFLYQTCWCDKSMGGNACVDSDFWCP